MGPAVVNSSAIAAHSWVGLRIMRRARSSQPGSLGSGMGFRAAGLAAILGAAPVRGGVGPRGGCAGPRGAVGPRGGCTGVGMGIPAVWVIPQDTKGVTRRTSHDARHTKLRRHPRVTWDVRRVTWVTWRWGA